MEAGKLSHRVTIQTATVAADGAGNRTETWSTHATVWAAVEPVTGREFIEGFRTNAEITHRVRIRYLSTVTAKMRVLEGTRHYDIVAVLDQKGQRREMHLMCREIT
jgi:SPP1 family predicted phage head-tail adaptor